MRAESNDCHQYVHTVIIVFSFIRLDLQDNNFVFKHVHHAHQRVIICISCIPVLFEGTDDALVIVSEGFHSRGGVPVLAISCSAPSGNATDEDDPQLNWYNPAGELINASGSK